MSASDFTHEIVIGVPYPQVRDFLADLHNIVPLHPLIISMEDLPALREMPGVRRYRVTDRIALGPLRMRVRYTAAIEVLGKHEILAHAWQSPGIHLRTVYRMKEAGEETRVTEDVWVEAPRILRGYVIDQASQSHEKMLTEMKTLLENRSRIIDRSG